MAVVTGQAVVFKGTNGLGILLGSGPPDSTIGVDGQPGYLDQTNNLLYGPKLAGAWPATGYQFGGNLLMYVGKPPDSFGRLGNLSLDISQGFIYGPKSAASWPAQPLLALVGPQGIQGVKGDPGAAGKDGTNGTSPTLPNDYTANSFVVTPVSGDTSPVQIALLNSSGTVLFKVDASGNVTIAGGVTVVGNATVGNLILASGGKITYPDGTTMNTAASGTGGSGTPSSTAASLDTIYMGLHQANGNYPTAYTASNGYFVNTQYASNTSVLATGSAYMSPYAGTISSIQIFAVSASNPISVCLYKNGVATNLVATSTSSGGGFYAMPSAPISVAVGDLFQLFIKGTTASMSNSCIGWLTVAPSISASAQATNSRAIVSGGSYYNTNITANAYWTTVTPKINNVNGTGAGSTEYFFKFPYACSLTGWSVNQYVANGTNQFQVCRNRTTNSLNNILTQTAGNATINGFPGSQFWGTWPKGTYQFAAGDTLSVVVSFSTGSSTNMDIQFTCDWA